MKPRVPVRGGMEVNGMKVGKGFLLELILERSFKEWKIKCSESEWHSRYRQHKKHGMCLGNRSSW